jgi:hypothetical protein
MMVVHQLLGFHFVHGAVQNFNLRVKKYLLLKDPLHFWNGELGLIFRYLAMLSGLGIALLNLFDPIHQGITRWLMVICGSLICIGYLKFVLDKKLKRTDNQKKTY